MRADDLCPGPAWLPPSGPRRELVPGYLYPGGRAAPCLAHEELPVHQGHGGRGEPERPRGRPVTHKRPRAKHQPWEHAVPSALRTSGVSGHFINSSP